MNFLRNNYFFRQTEEDTEKLRVVLVLLYTFSLPFDLFYSSVIFITLTVVTLLDVTRNKLKGVPKRFWIFQGVYFLALAGYFYSLHKNAAGFILERQVTILLWPLILPLAVKVTNEKLEMALSALAISCFIAIVYLFGNMIFTIQNALHLPLIQTAFSGAFFNHQFSRPIGIHAGYLSLYVSLSIMYLVSLINSYDSYKIKTGLIFCLILLFSGLLFLASRNTIITTFFILLFIFPLFNIKHKMRYILVSIICVVISFLIINKVPYFKERFSIELISDIKPLNDGKFVNYSATEPRIERWKCAGELIKKSPVFGYGTGDEIEMLKTEYAAKGLFISYVESFNAHNQYLSVWLKNGILGLLFFLILFYYYCHLAFKKRDFVYFSFLILLLIGFYTENILDANKGIVFFAFFNAFFGYRHLVNKNEKKVEV